VGRTAMAAAPVRDAPPRGLAPLRAPEVDAPAPGGRRAWAQVSEAEGIARLARLQVGQWRRASAAEQRAAAAQVALDVTGLALAEARRHRRSREWVIAGLYAGGWSYAKIAEAFDYAQPCTVRRVVWRPAVQQLLQRVRANQIEEILSGAYGVKVAARAAAPRVVEHVCDLAGAWREPDGTRRGRAARDRDCLRASVLVLGLAGHTGTQRPDPGEYPWLEECSETELEDYASRGIVPARFAAVLGPPACTAGADPMDTRVHTAPVPGGSDPVLAGDAPGHRAHAPAFAAGRGMAPSMGPRKEAAPDPVQGRRHGDSYCEG
jgi:hypothetical protein